MNRTGEPMTEASPEAAPVEVEAEVVGVPTREPPKPSNAEIAAAAAHAMDAVSSTAEALGVDGVAEIAREGANATRALVTAAQGVRREVEPARVAVRGLWNAMERRGIVGNRAPVNIADLQRQGGRRKRP